MKRKKLDQNGAVSFLSVIIFTIIISVLILAYVQSAMLQQRNANNYDYSTRAYYAAESGAQDAIRALRTTPAYQAAGKTDCAPAAINPAGTLGSGPQYGLSYTCQLIQTSLDEVRGDLIPNNGTAMIRLDIGPVAPPGGSPYRLIIRWSPSTAGTTNPTLYPRAASSQLPQYSDWNTGDVNQPLHAMLRMSLIKAPKSGSFSSSSVTQRVLFLNPIPTSPSPPQFTEYSLSAPTTGNISTQQEELIRNVQCVNSNVTPPATAPSYGNFSCMASFLLTNNDSQYGFSGNAVYLRLSSLYRSTSFSVALARNNGFASVIPLGNIQAAVDVTGKAGDDVYRRVQQNIKINGGYTMDYEPDAAVIGAEGICKQLSLGTSSSTFNNNPQCNPLIN